LCQFSIFEWSQNSDNFGIDNYYIDKNHEYNLKDIGAYLNEQNIVFYYRKKLIVPDIETANKLISFVSSSVLSDPQLKEKYKNKKYIDKSISYMYTSDFRAEQNQLIFMGKKSLLEWKANTSGNNFKIFFQTRPKDKNPYYYKNIFIEEGKLMILQNTKRSDFPSALAVSKRWEESGINVGYNPRDIYVSEIVIFDVYTEHGLTHRSKPNGKPKLKIFGYSDGSYAALLFL
jgi:hypothetical protein